MRTPRVGQILQVQFLDHCTNASEPNTHIVYGRLAEIADEYLVIDWWAHLDPATERKIGTEIECIVILRKVIEKIEVATEWRSL